MMSSLLCSLRSNSNRLKRKVASCTELHNEMLWGERRGQCHHRRSSESKERPMRQLNDLSRSLVTLEQDATLIAVIEMSLSSWLVAGIVPGVERQPLKKLAVDESALLKLLHRWREEAEKAGHIIKRIAVAFEAGRDGFWMARWLAARDIGALRLTGSTPSCSNVPFSAGCAASAITARWWRSRQSTTKTPSGPTASARALSESKIESSTE
jgi:hypothetical protein